MSVSIVLKVQNTKVSTDDKISKLTLDDAIEHCKEVIRNNDDCKECMNEHVALLALLEELKVLRGKDGCLNEVSNM